MHTKFISIEAFISLPFSVVGIKQLGCRSRLLSSTLHVSSTRKSLQLCFLSISVFSAVPCSMQNPSSPARNGAREPTPVLGAPGLNHWTTRAVPPRISIPSTALRPHSHFLSSGHRLLQPELLPRLPPSVPSPSLSPHHSRSGKCTIAVSLSRATETWGHLLLPHTSASADDTQLLPAPWLCRSLTLGLSLPLLSESPPPLLGFRSRFNVVFSASPSLSPQTGLCVPLTHSWDSLYCPHQHRLQSRRPRPLRGRHDDFLVHHGRPRGRCRKSLARVNQSLEPESFATLLLRGSH